MSRKREAKTADPDVPLGNEVMKKQCDLLIRSCAVCVERVELCGEKRSVAPADTNIRMLRYYTQTFTHQDRLPLSSLHSLYF